MMFLNFSAIIDPCEFNEQFIRDLTQWYAWENIDLSCGNCQPEV